MLSAYIQGVGILGPGLTDWPSAAEVLRGSAAYRSAATVLPAPAVLPPAERRRAGRVIRLTLGVGAQAVAAAGVDAHTLPSVFSSSGADGDNCHEICVTLASRERLLSPTRFHNSVHNAAAGYWSIAYGCSEASTALSAYDASFGAGLIEALSQLDAAPGALLLVVYDVDYPPPMRWKRPIPDAFAIALLLSSAQALGERRALGHLRLSLAAQPASVLAQPELEQLRRQIPAARGLPLLERLGHQRGGCVALDYLDEQRLRLELDL